MNFIIYRTSDGKRYPGGLTRLIMVMIFVVISFALVHGTLSIGNFKFAFWVRVISAVIVQEWIFQIFLWNANKFYNTLGKWRFFIFQVNLGFVLPTMLLLVCKSSFYDSNLITSANDSALQIDKILFYPHAIILINLLYYSLFIAQAGYTKALFFTDQNSNTKVFNTDDIDILMHRDTDIIFAMGDELFTTKTTASLKRQINNLNPLEFKSVVKGAYVSKRLLSDTEDNGENILVKRLYELKFFIK